MRRMDHHRQVLDRLRRSQIPTPVLQAFGDLIEDAQYWNTRADGLFESTQGNLVAQQVSIPTYNNYNTSFLAPFAIANASYQILPSNTKRTMLVIQNLSTSADLYFNLGGGASQNNGILLTAGQGFVFDSVCPNDSVNAFFNSGTAQLGVVLEVRFTAN